MNNYVLQFQSSQPLYKEYSLLLYWSFYLPIISDNINISKYIRKISKEIARWLSSIICPIEVVTFWNVHDPLKLIAVVDPLRAAKWTTKNNWHHRIKFHLDSSFLIISSSCALASLSFEMFS